MKCQQNYLKNKKGSRSFLFSIEIKKQGKLPCLFSLYKIKKEGKIIIALFPAKINFKKS